MHILILQHKHISGIFEVAIEHSVLFQKNILNGHLQYK